MPSATGDTGAEQPMRAWKFLDTGRIAPFGGHVWPAPTTTGPGEWLRFPGREIFACRLDDLPPKRFVAAHEPQPRERLPFPERGAILQIFLICAELYHQGRIAAFRTKPGVNFIESAPLGDFAHPDHRSYGALHGSYDHAHHQRCHADHRARRSARHAA